MNIRFIHLGRPVPKGGLNAKYYPKSGKTALWYPTRVKQAERALAASGRQAMQEASWPILDARCRVFLRFYMKPTKTGKLHADLDKLVRLAFDALTGVCWSDDSWIQSVTASKHPVECSYTGAEIGLERTEVDVCVLG